MVDYAACRSEFDERGFVIVRQFLPADELALLNRELDRYIAQVLPTLPDSAAFFHVPGRRDTLKQMQHMDADPFFADYVRHPRWKTLAEQLLGEPVEAQAPEWFNKPPGTDHVTPPHQDNYYFCLRPPQVLTAWLALDAVDEQNGCLRYLPGSHRAGVRPHEATRVLGFSQGITDYAECDREREVAVVLRPGDLAVHHGETIHRADPNRSADRQRRSFAIVFRGASCRRDAQAYQRYEAAMRRQHTGMGLGYVDAGAHGADAAPASTQRAPESRNSKLERETGK